MSNNEDLQQPEEQVVEEAQAEAQAEQPQEQKLTFEEQVEALNRGVKSSA